MTAKKERDEMRHQQRFQTMEGAYAVLRYKPAELGQIINISKDGLAVRYSNNGLKLGGTPELDIFIADHHFYMKNIPVRTVYDFEPDDASLGRSRNMRQRCFQFEEMMSCQLFQLNYFLENYTV